MQIRCRECVALDQRVHAAAGEHDHQHRHQDRRDQEERSDRNLHRREANHEEDDQQHHRGCDGTNHHAMRIAAHRVNRLVEDHRLGAFTEHGEEAQHGERDHRTGRDLFAGIDL